MSGLCGWFQRGIPAGAEPGVLESMSRAITQWDAAPARINSAGWGAVAAAAPLNGCDTFQEGQRLAATWGRLRFNEARLNSLARRHGAACALAEAHAEKGPELLQDLAGSFAIAVLDRSRDQAFLAVDRMGANPLSYAATDGRLVFGSNLDAIGAYPGVGDEVSAQAVYDYVYFHVVPSPSTIYKDRSRLLAGTYLTFSHGVAKVAPYWRMPFDEHRRASFPELKEQFLGNLRGSVVQASAEGRAGAFLSGGTDSSTIAGMLRAVTGEAPRTYSIGFDAEGFDEMHYARVAARHFATQHNEYYVTPADVVAAIPEIAAVHDQPFGNSSAVPTYFCARLAKQDGVEVLLGGDGGDELFGGNSRYAMQYLYSLYSDLPAVMRERCIEPVAFVLPPLIAGKLQRYIRSASMPMPARYDKFNLLEHFGPAAVFTPEFQARVDVAEPRAGMAAVYADTNARTLINRMLAFDMKYTLADNDLPKVQRSCELAGVDVRFPMLDDALVAFAARLAPGMKLKGTRLRYFFKEALRDFLPKEILNKTKHGFGLPFGRWLLEYKPMAELALDSLSDLKKRRIIRASFIDELTSVHVQRHADYFSTLVWVLMMLEQWFKRDAVQGRSHPDAPVEASMECMS